MSDPIDPIRRFEDVCSLSEEELRERRALLRAELEPWLLRRETLPDGLAFEFDARARRQVEALVRLERECCAPLSIELAEIPDGLRLEMREPPQDPSSRNASRNGSVANESSVQVTTRPATSPGERS